MKYKTSIIAVSIHPEKENPIFGSGVTHIKIQDDAGGAFIELEQFPETPKEEHTVEFDIEELELVTKTARKMIDDLKESK